MAFYSYDPFFYTQVTLSTSYRTNSERSRAKRDYAKRVERAEMRERAAASVEQIRFLALEPVNKPRIVYGDVGVRNLRQPPKKFSFYQGEFA